MPEAIQNAPQIFLGLEIYYEAFIELTTCRQLKWNGSPGPIPWTALNEYAKRHGFDGGDFDYLIQMVRAVDDAYLEHVAANQKDK